MDGQEQNEKKGLIPIIGYTFYRKNNFVSFWVLVLMSIALLSVIGFVPFGELSFNIQIALLILTVLAIILAQFYVLEDMIQRHTDELNNLKERVFSFEKWAIEFKVIKPSSTTSSSKKDKETPSKP